MTAKRKRGGLSGETLGGMLAGFDQQIMRTQPPPHELVQKGAPVRGLSGEGDDLVIVLPDAEPAPGDVVEGERPSEPPSDPG